MQRFYKFIVVCLLLGANSLTTSAQTSGPAPLLKRTLINGKILTYPWLKKAAPISRVASISEPQETPKTLQPLRPDQYVRSFGFFCQVEYKLEKTTRLPLRFRIGQLDYINRLEGKN